VFVDSEGIFYNGYNVLRGAPKIWFHQKKLF
jgi:hypothetical protein